MTDTTGGRGGVGIRLFVSGGEVVKRTFDQVGDSGKKMWAQIALGEKATNPAFRAVSRGANEVRDGIQDLAGRTGAAGNVLSAFGATGVAVAAVMAGVAVAVTQAKEAMAFADEIDDAAQKLNIGTSALQEYRFAMTEVGGVTTDADAAIEKFNKTLGAAQSGLSPRAMKPFAALGFTRDQLQSFDSGEEALAEVARRVSALSKESERAAVAEKLGLGPMLPLLREGADGMEALRQKARDLGIVMDEGLVKTGADANQKLEVMSEIIRVQMAESFVGLSDEILAFTANIAEALKALNRFLDRYNDWKARAEVTGDAPDETEQRLSRFGPAGGLAAFARNRLRAGWRFVTGTTVSAEDAARTVQTARDAREPLPGEPPPASDPDVRLNDTSTSRSGGGSGAADRAAAQRERDQKRLGEQLVRDLDRAERDAVRLRHAGETADDRLRLAQETARLQREERDAQRDALVKELERVQAVDDATKAQLASLAALDAEADALADRAIAETHRKDLAEEALRRDQAREDDALALLDIESQLATTRQEQYAIERRILILRQAAERRALEAELNADESLSEAEKASRLGSADYRNRLQLGLFDDTERSRAQAEFRSFGHDIIEGVKSGKLGQHIAEEMQARLIDMALNGLFDFLNPRGANGQAYSGGQSSIWKMGLDAVASLFSGGSPTGPGRAGGGGLMRGYRHPVAETGRPELMMIGGNGHVTDAVTTQRMLQDLMETERGGANGGRSGAGETILVHVDKSEYFDVEVQRVTGPAIRASTAASERRVLDATRKGAPGVQARMRQLGTA